MADNNKKAQKPVSASRASSRYGSSASGASFKEYLIGGGIVAIAFVVALLAFNRKDKTATEEQVNQQQSAVSQQQQNLLDQAAIKAEVDEAVVSYKKEADQQTLLLKARLAELEEQLQDLQKTQQAKQTEETADVDEAGTTDMIAPPAVPPVQETAVAPPEEEPANDTLDDIINNAADNDQPEEEAGDVAEAPEEAPAPAVTEETTEEQPAVAAETKPVKVRVTKTDVSLNGKTVALEDLTAALKARETAPEDQNVSLAAKADVSFQRMRLVMKAVTDAGWRVSSMKTAAADAEETTAAPEDSEKDFEPVDNKNTEVTDKLVADALALAKDNKFAEAIAKIDSRPDLRDPLWQAEREKTRQIIRKQANELYQMDLARAEKLAREGKTAGAKAVYRTIAGYGTRDMVKEATARIARLNNEPEAPAVQGTEEQPAVEEQKEVEPVDVGAAETDPNVDPRISRYIETLKNKQASQSERKDAARELGLLKVKEAVEPLIETLNDPDWFLRMNAANALKQIGDKRAVPALIDNLGHHMIPVREIAHDALVELTGKDFGRDQEAWRKWWTENMPKAEEPQTEQPQAAPAEATPIKEAPATEENAADEADVEEAAAEQPAAFKSQIIVFKPEDQSLIFNLAKDAKIEEGQQVQILRDGKPLATVEVTLVGFGTATADIKNAAIDATFKAGQLIEVQP